MKKNLKLGIAITVALLLYIAAFFFIDFLGSVGGINLTSSFWLLVIFGVIGVGCGMLLQFVQNKYNFDKKKEGIINAIAGIVFYYILGLLPISGVVIGMIIMEKNQLSAKHL
jgi:hypothetical protein